MGSLRYAHYEDMSKNSDLKEMINTVKRYYRLTNTEIRSLKFISNSLFDYIIDYVVLEKMMVSAEESDFRLVEKGKNKEKNKKREGWL